MDMYVSQLRRSRMQVGTDGEGCMMKEDRAELR